MVYRNLWPGIDLAYSGADNEVKYELTVRPGADPNQIKWTYRGATVVPDGSGGLKIDTPIGGLEDKQPYSYQEHDGQQTPVATSFKLDPVAGSREKVCGFNVGDYDRSRPLTIDPAVIAYAGYIGGTFVDNAFGIAVDSAGAAYVTGYTESFPTDQFPLIVGPGLTFNTNKMFLFWTAFVAKVKPDGSALQYCGYIDGAGHQLGSAIAVDSTGAAYVTGFTTSDQTTFPVTVGPTLIYSGGITPVNSYMGDAFVAKVKPDGTGLVYCGYIGGQGDDAGYGIAVDSAGNAYVTGETSSDQSTFPVKVGPSLTFAGAEVKSADNFNPGDAFVAKVSPSGSSLIYCGYIGGSGGDAGYRIAVDSAGSAYITGSTNSSAATFPVTAASGAAATFSGGTVFGDAFLAKVDPSGSKLLYAGYLGGSSDDAAVGIAVDSSGNVYLAGGTMSAAPSFPATVGPFLTFKPGTFGEPDAFVAKITGLPQAAPPTPDFSLSFAEPTIMTTGGKSKITLNITRLNGFTGNVNIGAPANTPRGILVVLDPSTPVSGDSLGFKIKVKGSADVGTDSLVFTGVNDSGSISHSVTLTLVVQSGVARPLNGDARSTH